MLVSRRYKALLAGSS